MYCRQTICQDRKTIIIGLLGGSIIIDWYNTKQNFGSNNLDRTTADAASLYSIRNVLVNSVPHSPILPTLPILFYIFPIHNWIRMSDKEKKRRQGQQQQRKFSNYQKISRLNVFFSRICVKSILNIREKKKKKRDRYKTQQKKLT